MKVARPPVFSANPQRTQRLCGRFSLLSLSVGRIPASLRVPFLPQPITSIQQNT
jgi:hypothetical protein